MGQTKNDYLISVPAGVYGDVSNDVITPISVVGQMGKFCTDKFPNVYNALLILYHSFVAKSMLALTLCRSRCTGRTRSYKTALLHCNFSKTVDINDKKLTIRAVQLFMSDITNKYCDPTSDRCGGELSDMLRDQEKAEELLQALSKDDEEVLESMAVTV